MVFEIVLTSQAQLDFKNITDYLRYKLKSKQAAINVADDMETTIERLSRTADDLKLCEDPSITHAK